jgi:hypothetical protein
MSYLDDDNNASAMVKSILNAEDKRINDYLQKIINNIFESSHDFGDDNKCKNCASSNVLVYYDCPNEPPNHKIARLLGADSSVIKDADKDFEP